MELTAKLLTELQRRLKIGNRRGVHLNAIPANSRYKFDLNRLAHIDKNLPNNFIKALLSEQPLKFRISWKDNVPDLNSLFEEEQTQLVRITKAFENLINQTEALESEKGINTFGFGFPILARRDKADNKLTVAPVLIWSLRIKRTKEFNTWEILRNEDDPVYINEVLINHLQNDANVEIEQIPSEMLDDGLIERNELIEICTKLIRTINSTSPDDLEETFRKKLDIVVSIGDKAHYEKLPLNSTNSLIDFGGLFSIFEVQKQNIINDYGNLMELEGINIPLEDLEGHSFQPISSVETDPSQQSILHSLEATRNILIQGPPGTGKSQTLTAVLINALENNKKTIVVCEKRTALEVLHNALIEKGLNFHCVLVRDIVKDRKTVVDSVRDRVDNSEYKRYRYNYSKESLDNLIKKANDLIININNKHQKLDTKLIGNKSWSDVVGNLLAELKENPDDSNLNVEKKLFNYSTQELNMLIDLVQKGQTLYKEYFPIESTSFINTQKLVGDNPYLIEQSINEDFEFYSKQLEQIKLLLETNRSEYLNLRKTEINNQISSIEKCIENSITKENELGSLIENAKNEYLNFRNIEFAQQIESISQILSQIDSIFGKNEHKANLIDTDKINSFGFKLLSIFSKRKKQIIADHIELQRNYIKLDECLKISKDFQTLNFTGSMEARVNSLPTLKTEITKIKYSFSDKIENEFTLFNLNTILDTNDNATQFQSIHSEVNDSNNSDAFIAKLQSIQTTFVNYLSEIKTLFKTLSRDLAESKDIKLTRNFDKTFKENMEAVSELKAKIELIKADFDSKIQNEFRRISLLAANPNVVEIKSLPILQEKVNALAFKIKGDSWTVEKVKFADVYEFVSDIETLIRNKYEYFKAEKDLFTIEFKWFQFYNALSESEKTIINELKPKINWRKTFLVFYLNSLLVNSANFNLPTSDDEHKELENTLNGVEKEQLKFIKEFWFSKQIDSTREFERIPPSNTISY